MSQLNHEPLPGGNAGRLKAQQSPHPLHIARSAINQLPLRAYQGPVVLIADPHAAAAAAVDCGREKILGFDTETRAAFRKGQTYAPALVQLATGSHVYLFRVQMPGVLEACLPVLESAAVQKAGVAISDDIKALQAMHPFVPAGFVELQTLSSKHGLRNNGLRGLTALLLGFRISKGAQTSNWETSRLTERQLRYAATDAWVAREIHCALRTLSG